MSAQDTYREGAAKCLELANQTTDQHDRTRLILLAGKFLDLASRPAAENTLSLLLEIFNENQMRA